jgi:hypothetical protein
MIFHAQKRIWFLFGIIFVRLGDGVGLLLNLQLILSGGGWGVLG